jgi:hypothetical protein
MTSAETDAQRTLLSAGFGPLPASAKGLDARLDSDFPQGEVIDAIETVLRFAFRVENPPKMSMPDGSFEPIPHDENVLRETATKLFARLSEIIDKATRVTVQPADTGQSESTSEPRASGRSESGSVMADYADPEAAAKFLASIPLNMPLPVAREMLLQMVKALDEGRVGEAAEIILVPLPGFGNR